MKASELREMSQAELRETLNDLLKEQFNLRMQRGTCLLYTSDAADERG